MQEPPTQKPAAFSQIMRFCFLLKEGLCEGDFVLLAFCGGMWYHNAENTRYNLAEFDTKPRNN